MICFPISHFFGSKLHSIKPTGNSYITYMEARRSFHPILSILETNTHRKRCSLTFIKKNHILTEICIWYKVNRKVENFYIRFMAARGSIDSILPIFDTKSRFH